MVRSTDYFDEIVVVLRAANEWSHWGVRDRFNKNRVKGN